MMSQTEYRNVVLLTADQLRWDTIHALGNEVIRTPNLDRLCSMGVAFTHAFTPVPVCAAARHRLFTGADSRTIGKVNSKLCWSPQTQSIQNVLYEAGYHTGGFGKMHFKNVRNGYGFGHLALHEEMQYDGEEYREDDDYAMYLKKQGLGHIRWPNGVRNLLYYQPQISPIPEEHHETKWVADRAIDFIETFKDTPFFCYASWMQPHWPVHVPENWANLYPSESMSSPVYDEGEIPHLPYMAEQQRRASNIFDDGKAPALQRLRRSKALYYASISFIDHQIGRILEKLEEHDLIDKTLIIFTADHGEMLGDHQTFDKSLAYESSIRVPMIVVDPRTDNPGEASKDFAGLADVAPTIYEFTGIEPPKQCPLAGSSLLGERQAVRKRDAMFFEHGEGKDKCSFIAVRTKKWKYAYYPAGALRQLFDLANDPNELENLLLEPKEEDKQTAELLHKRLLAWHKEHGIDSWIENGDFPAVERPDIPLDRNAQYEEYFDRIPEEERKGLWSHARCVYEATKNEKEIDLADLDLEYWESKFGPGAIEELESLTGRKLR
jgi:arylsulfatase A-like enzyme